MSLARRIIPTILCRGRHAVKGQKFDSWRSVGLALQAATVHARRQVDELLLLDVSATAEGRGPDLDMVRELSEGCFIPITVGGGVRSLQDIDALLRAGADKVCIGTATGAPGSTLLEDASARFGSQALVASMDLRQVPGFGQVPTFHCGKTPMAVNPLNWALDLERRGAGEILLSSVDLDGTMDGYDLGPIAAISQAVHIPVIASGGCGSYYDMLLAFRAGADACAAGALFAFTDCVPKGAAQFLKQHGIEVRL